MDLTLLRNSVVILVAGMYLLIKGADLFVDGASSVARKLRIPSLIIGLTLVSIGTSAPELSVSISAALKGNNDLSFGNVIGSNIFNTLMVVGISALFVPLTVSKDMKKYDIPILVGIYLLLAVFAFAITPLCITRAEAAVLFAMFFIYTAFLIFRSRKEMEEKDEASSNRKWYNDLFAIAIGLCAIIFGGDLVVDSASDIARLFGMSDLLIGLTIVAVGTSLPELVTSMIAAKKGEHDIAVGNAVGSCLFNIVLILGSSAIISPITTLAWSSAADLAVMLASIVILYAVCLKSNKVKRPAGIAFIILYALYLTYIIMRDTGII